VLGEMKNLQALSIGALRNVERPSPLDGKPSGTLRYLTLERLLGLQMFEELGSCAALEELYLDIVARPADRGLGSDGGVRVTTNESSDGDPVRVDVAGMHAQSTDRSWSGSTTSRQAAEDNG
jgi:hypothetical protein